MWEKGNIIVYEKPNSLCALISRCASIVTKPGGVIITEAHKARRRIFLIDGLPVTEQANARYAVENFSAAKFSLKTFSRWYAQVKDGKNNERIS